MLIRLIKNSKTIKTTRVQKGEKLYISIRKTIQRNNKHRESVKELLSLQSTTAETAQESQ